MCIWVNWQGQACLVTRRACVHTCMRACIDAFTFDQLHHKPTPRVWFVRSSLRNLRHKVAGNNSCLAVRRLLRGYASEYGEETRMPARERREFAV